MNSFCLHNWPSKRGKGNKALRGRPRILSPLIDKGTPELQSVRKRLLKDKANSRLSTTALDIMYAQDLLDQKQHEAGLVYGKICMAAKRAIMAPSIARINPDSLIEGHNGCLKIRLQPVMANDDKDKKILKRWRKARSILGAMGEEWAFRNYISTSIIQVEKQMDDKEKLETKRKIAREARRTAALHANLLRRKAQKRNQPPAPQPKKQD